jgi:hypothetical protein
MRWRGRAQVRCRLFLSEHRRHGLPTLPARYGRRPGLGRHGRGQLHRVPRGHVSRQGRGEPAVVVHELPSRTVSCRPPQHAPLAGAALRMLVQSAPPCMGLRVAVACERVLNPFRLSAPELGLFFAGRYNSNRSATSMLSFCLPCPIGRCVFVCSSRARWSCCCCCALRAGEQCRAGRPAPSAR